jgi:hypothetical protein
MSDPLRLRPLGEHAALVRDRLAGLSGAQLVDDPERAELVVMTPEDLAELDRRRRGNRCLSPHPRPRARADRRGRPADRPREPGPGVCEHRGHSLRQLAEVGIGYLSQIENGERKGTVGSLKKIAAALDVDLDDLT